MSLVLDLFGKGDGGGINMRSITAMGVVGAFSCTVVKQVLPTSMRASQFAACYFSGIYIARDNSVTHTGPPTLHLTKPREK